MHLHQGPTNTADVQWRFPEPRRLPEDCPRVVATTSRTVAGPVAHPLRAAGSGRIRLLLCTAPPRRG
jgi:hypothetical protein